MENLTVERVIELAKQNGMGWHIIPNTYYIRDDRGRCPLEAAAKVGSIHILLAYEILTPDSAGSGREVIRALLNSIVSAADSPNYLLDEERTRIRQLMIDELLGGVNNV